MAAIDDVIAWAGTLPPWQADAVRRLLDAGDDELSASDEAELLALAREALDLGPAPAGLTATPPKSGAFSGAPGATVDVRLLAISDMQHVNILKPGLTQPFAEHGVTVIYGENGSGKSGYSRVLKQACQARDKADTIIPNVFSLPMGAPSAVLHIKENGVPRTVPWMSGSVPDPVLTNICVFDGRCARIITDEKNQISYRPYGTHVFERLVPIVQHVRASVEAEQQPLVPIQDSLIHADSPAALFLRSLGSTTKPEAIDAATAWTVEDDGALSSKEALARDSGAKAAGVEIDRLTRLRSRILGAGSSASTLASVAASCAKETLIQALQELHVSKQAHATAVAQRKGNEPLAGVGATNQWEVLYNAAKRYSVEVAYPGKPFPHTTDALCVLCQQPLQAEAAARFARFKAFVEDATSAVLATKRDRIAALRRSLESLAPLEGDALGAVCDDVATQDQDAGDLLRQFHTDLSTQRAFAMAALAEDAEPEAIAKLGSWPASPQQTLEPVAERIAAQIASITETAKPEEYKKLLVEISHLKARQALSNRRAEVDAFVAQAKRNQKLLDAASTLRTQEITKKGTSLIRHHSTPDLLASVHAELAALGAERLPIAIRPSGSEGATAHEFVLEGAAIAIRAPMSQVLSEGEARVIGIAGFLAELQLSPQTKSIVFDDPVSSLDHVFTRKIAERLIGEGLSRQVIIFSHNIAFLMELQDAQAEHAKAGQPVHLEVHTLLRDGGVAGITTQGPPWSSMDIGRRAHQLDQWLNACKALHGTDTPAYNKEAAFIYARLREAWESCVENDIFYSVVCRYRNSVATLKLVQVEIQDTDIHTVDLNMSKTSTWMLGHDKSKALDQNRPAPDELQKDIAALRTFSKLITGRRDATQKRRKGQLVA